MADDAPEPPPPFEPLPDVFEIPPEAIERWKGLTSARPLAVSFGKHQLDNLMIGLRQSVLAQMSLGDAVFSLSNSDTEAAKREFRRHQELTRYSYSNLNWFIQHVMMTAQPEEPTNG